MEPLVALGYFIIQQKLSLEEIEKKDDPTIKMLYKISQDAFGEIYREETISKRVEDICSQTYDIIKSAKRTLAKDVREEVQRKRTADILDSGLETIQELRRKHSVIYTSGKRQRLSDEDGDDLDWKFVQTFKQEHVGRMDWKLCFQFGKEKNLFSKYSSSQSLRSAFNRHCKK
ncbi:hypothetical protein CLU79DRAFT_692620 [Phycomyces nitens]|nr:hypothetical protein CLU79DRAFT_692620 [Phycomyces nitens]